MYRRAQCVDVTPCADDKLVRVQCSASSSFIDARCCCIQGMTQERKVSVHGGPAVTVVATSAPLAAALLSPEDLGIALTVPAVTTGATATKNAALAGYYCAPCRMGFNDAVSLAAHRLTKKHKAVADDFAEPAAPSAASVADLRALIERRRAEKGASCVAAPAPPAFPSPVKKKHRRELPESAE